MGQRDDLLAGAKRCLREKGYGRTTARDITAASGASLAAIGYHFGSKEALLNTALIEANGEWGQELQRALTAEAFAELEPLERFERIWTRVVELFATHRHLWVANFECLAQVDHVPDIRQAMTEGLHKARTGLAMLFHHLDATTNERAAWIVGSLYQALLIGVMEQWMVDPDSAPSGQDLADALRMIIAKAGHDQPSV